MAEVTKKALADLKAGHAEAKKALDDAIIAWKASPFAKVVERKGSGSPRIVGKDRYETSALLSYYLRGASNSRNSEAGLRMTAGASAAGSMCISLLVRTHT
ncbi:hypothetical protein [Mobiluncus mulieris]|uniref:hypothetical protein n=1 Tax=Mobiluncus mulieris TaxID=2052 RepID=UPI000B6395B0|nr:hypothetical protein [Mobiluncus mulieris]PNL40863.1 hypothetical protein CEP82_011550 [Mobiluncus mulieris]